jgi:hypothetical protein
MNLGLALTVETLDMESGADIETEASEVIELEEGLTIISKARIRNMARSTFVAKIPQRG